MISSKMTIFVSIHPYYITNIYEHDFEYVVFKHHQKFCIMQMGVCDRKSMINIAYNI